MKPLLILVLVQSLVQSAAMLFFMQVVHLKAFASAGWSAVIALLAGFGAYWILKRKTDRKDRD